MSMKIVSTAFEHQGMIPSRYTCDGTNVSPPLSWSELPAGTRSLALIVTDPDAPDPKAPKTTWVHWVLYDLPADATGLREAIPPKGLPPGTLEGANDWGKIGYGGPCPPRGSNHRYYFKVYALSAPLELEPGAKRDAVLKALKQKTLAEGQLMGRYGR